jgi:hypothetical protein
MDKLLQLRAEMELATEYANIDCGFYHGKVSCSRIEKWIDTLTNITLTQFEFKDNK